MAGYPNQPTRWKIVDYPASYHVTGGFSFADGHSEIKKWQDGRTTPIISKADRPLDVLTEQQRRFWMRRSTYERSIGRF
jgi:hypothetical protein